MFTTTRFDSWDLPDEIQSSLKAIGWEFATQVQRDTIPLARNGTDVIGQARTGSGKTAAFGLPILERCQATGSLQALVLAPTRELANQVAEELTMLQGEAGLTILTVYGGTDLEKQAKTLSKGVDIIVGTPGRVMDMTERGHINLTAPTLLCLDEADRMLDMGFFPDIMWVVERMTSREQTLLFSATFPQEIIDAAHEFMNEPDFVLTNAESLDIPPIDLYSVRIGRSNKLWVLGRLLVRMDDDDQTIIFCNTKRMVDLAVERLKKHRFDVAGLHGDLSQNQRERIFVDSKKARSRPSSPPMSLHEVLTLTASRWSSTTTFPTTWIPSFIESVEQVALAAAVKHGVWSLAMTSHNSRRSWPPMAWRFNPAKHLNSPGGVERGRSPSR